MSPDSARRAGSALRGAVVSGGPGGGVAPGAGAPGTAEDTTSTVPRRGRRSGYVGGQTSSHLDSDLVTFSPFATARSPRPQVTPAGRGGRPAPARSPSPSRSAAAWGWLDRGTC